MYVKLRDSSKVRSSRYNFRYPGGNDAEEGRVVVYTDPVEIPDAVGEWLIASYPSVVEECEAPEDESVVEQVRDKTGKFVRRLSEAGARAKGKPVADPEGA